jgi:hypothetical protein
MKKYIFLVVGIWVAISAFSQSVTFPENFDGNNITFTSSPASAWKKENNYYINSPNSIRGVVPNMIGDSIVMTSPVYNLVGYSHVLLRFSHICKVSPMDIVRIEVRTQSMAWEPLPTTVLYMGKATQYQTRGFNAASYTEWRSGDSLALPSQSWWKEEVFDVGHEVGGDREAQFRFILKHGNAPGTQISYGWLIDNIEIIAYPYEVKLPVVEFVAPLIKETVNSAGPWTINAKVKSQTIAQIENPWLKYTATCNGVSVANDSILMDMLKGDSLWKANIPQFIPGTEVVYSITGRDITGNTASITSGYVIAKPNHPYGDTSVALTSINSPVQEQVLGGVGMPINVTIRNKGDSALTSVDIYYSVNGVTSPYPWTGNLSWDFEQQITIGNYTPRNNMYDTIVVWISMPNGIEDINLTDDTLTVITFGCAGNMSGTYTVGQGGLYPDLKEALTALNLCLPAGDITFLLQTGDYPENLDLTNISNLMGNHTLTITSAKSDADSVILRPASGVGIRLANSNNLVIKDITVDAASSGTNAIQFSGSCNNVLIRDCKLLVSLASSYPYTAPIYKDNDYISIADNISIINNILDGGYFGFYFNGGTGTGTGQYGTNIVFDSNTVINSESYGICAYYLDFTSCSYNTIQSRTTSTYSWYGLYLQYSNGYVLSNRIMQRNNSISQPYGINVQYFNTYNTMDTGLIANNEIILNTTGNYPGIYVANTKAKILHNSIYVSGSGGARGIQIVNNSNNYLMIKNNNIAMESTSAYPIYLNTNANLALYDMDYNNMYAPNNAGYVGGIIADIPAWQDVVTSDHHSVKVEPLFMDATVDLKLTVYVPFLTPILSEVGRDIEGIYRLGTYTAMGCYHGLTPYSINGSLGNISGFRTGGVLGQQDSIKVELFNTGTSALTTATLNWSVNGVTQSTIGINWSGSLLTEQRTVITLGEIDYTQPGNNTIRVWIDNLGASQDEYSADDTVSISGYICATALNGTYTVGNGGDFSSWDATLEMVKLCGIDGDITFEFLSGEYAMDFDLSDNFLLFKNYMLTITSFTHKAEDVIFKTGTCGMLLQNSKNIIIDAITIDASAGNYAILFKEGCTHIVIRNCVLLADSVSTTNDKFVICKEGNWYTGVQARPPDYIIGGTGTAENISITKNIISGGYVGIFFYAGTGTNLYGKNIVIDSNIVKNQSGRAISVTYADSVSVSNNRIASRINNISTSWQGMGLGAINGSVLNNRILQRSNDISAPTGISVSQFNYYSTNDTGMIANNEIILNATGSNYGSDYYGLSIGSGTISKVLHNSVSVSGTGDMKGVYISGDASSFVTFKNNNIIMEASLSYPVYLGSTANLQNYDIDYNNMYAPINLAYAGLDIKSIQRWRQLVTTDRHSVSVNPVFVDRSVDFRLVDYKGLESYPLLETPVDIEENDRTGITAMGCYQGFDLYNTNAMLVDIQGIQPEMISGTTETIKAVLVNMGDGVLTDATFNWSFNGSVQGQTPISWSGNLSKGQMDTIILGMLAIPAGYYSLQAWIDGLGSLQDQYSHDDTTAVSGYICASPWNGTITIGTTGTFQSVNEVLDKLYLCGVNGDITLALEPGEYNESIELTNISNLMGSYHLTFTSTTHNAEDVKIVTNTVGFFLSNANNLRIEALTVDATEGKYGVHFAGACTNVVIRDCRLLLDTTLDYSHSIYPIYGFSVDIDSIFIINNLLDGGYAGLKLYPGTNIVFDSNTLTNQYRYGIDAEFTSFTKCSYNTFLSRTTNPIETSSYWYGIRMYSCRGDIVGNRIVQRSAGIMTGHGIDLLYHYYSGTTSGLIANNEIILITGDGISANTSGHADILHNSIYISNTNTSSVVSAGISLYDGAGNAFVIKNNNIVMGHPSAYPIYVSTSISPRGNFKGWDVNYNNYFAPTYIGSVGASNYTSLSAWESAMKTDVNSVSVRPDFVDSSINLQWNSYKGLECVPVSKALVDINEQSRARVTVMGCYHNYVNMVNAKLTNVSQWGGIYVGTTDTIKVQIANMAVTNITDATLYWSFNGGAPQSYTWNGNLGTRQSSILTLGTITFTSGTNTLDIWIGNLGTLTDEISTDDTIHESFSSCAAGLAGPYTIGTTGAFTTIDAAIAQLKLCDAVGDITFALLPNTYTGTIDLSDLPLNAYTLTLTSSTNDTADVIIETTEAGILLGNSRNIIIKNLTIDATNGMYGVRLNNDCSNITIRDCHIVASSASSYGVFKAEASGTVDNIVISNNVIEGGNNGIYFYGGTDPNVYSTRVVIDSNTINSQISTGAAMDVSYTDFTRIAANNISKVYQGILLTYSNGAIINNKIVLDTMIKAGIGLSVSNYSTYNAAAAGLIANNEIMLAPSTEANMAQPLLYAIRIGTNTYTDVFHNSIYASAPPVVTGSRYGCAFGIDVSDIGNHLIRIKNNNIRIDGGSVTWIRMLGRPTPSSVYSAPILLYPLPAQYDIDYNNMYSPTYVGAIGTNISGNVTMTEWQQQITTDLHSVSILSEFVDSSVNLMLDDYLPFLCPFISRVTTDIQRNPRSATTVMGAYSNISSDYNLMLTNITRMENEVINKQTVQVGVEVINAGSVTPIDSAIFRWSVGGVTQPKSYKWVAAHPLLLGEREDILIDSFAITGSSYVEVMVWAEKINEGKDSIAFDDTISRIAEIVPLARFAAPIVADTLHALSFDVYVKIMEGSGALLVTPVPKMNIQTQMSNGIILYDTIDMTYNSTTDLWVAAIPQQYYGSSVRYSLTVSDTAGNSIFIRNETYLQFVSGSESYTGAHIAVTALQGLVALGTSCIPDYVTATVILSNVGKEEYDFSNAPVKLYMQVTQPEPFYIDRLITSGLMTPGEEMAIEMTNMFPTVVAGQYDIRVWIDSVSPIVYDDTLALDYVSGKFGLPIDEDFSHGIPIVFASQGLNTFNKWDTISQGTGMDATILPQFGTSMITFKGSPGSMTTLSTQQLDLSRTVQPALSFWYFHDTAPCEDYTDVRITVDGGTTYNTLFSLSKYDAAYGWRQYSMDLPAYAVNQCVELVFESMEKSRSGDVAQYIDRIRIIARQDIKVADVIIPELAACDLQNRDVQVVLSNLTDPVLDYATMNTTVTLEIAETGQKFNHLVTSGNIGSFASDTITVATGVDFTKGT